MEQSRSQEANRFSARQEIPSIVWNPKVHYRTHKSQSPVSILTRAIQSIPQSHFLMIYLNIILSSMPESSKWYLFLKFPHQSPVYTSPLTYTCYMHYPSHSSWFVHPNNICWEVRIINLLIRQSSPFPCYLLSLKSYWYPPHHHILRHSQPTFLLQCERPHFTPIQNSKQNYSSVNLNLYIFGQPTGRPKILHRMIGSIPRFHSTLISSWMEFWFFSLFPNTRTFPPFQRNYC